jgi:hypothetical protein
MVLLQQGIPENLHGSLIFDEDQRALDVCRLIKGLSLDGIARMNAGFKVLLCDYASVGVKLLFSSNATVPRAQKRKENQRFLETLIVYHHPDFGMTSSRKVVGSGLEAIRGITVFQLMMPVARKRLGSSWIFVAS